MEKICQHCGKEFKAKSRKIREHSIAHYGDNGLTLERVNICADCWLDFLDRRNAAEDKFYKECVYGKQSNQK